MQVDLLSDKGARRGSKEPVPLWLGWLCHKMTAVATLTWDILRQVKGARKDHLMGEGPPVPSMHSSSLQN